MTGYFVTDDDRGRSLWRGTPDDPHPVRVESRDDGEDAFFDAARVLLAPDEGLVERISGSTDVPLLYVRWVLAALREEAGA